MNELENECYCESCESAQPVFYVAPLAQLNAVRGRSRRAPADRPDCPRCEARLGVAEVVVDSVGFSHIVQPCPACAALWVL